MNFKDALYISSTSLQLHTSITDQESCKLKALFFEKKSLQPSVSKFENTRNEHLFSLKKDGELF